MNQLNIIRVDLTKIIDNLRNFIVKLSDYELNNNLLTRKWRKIA